MVHTKTKSKSMNVIISALMAFSIGLSSPIAKADESTLTYQRTVASGHTITLGLYYSANLNCESMGDTYIRIKTAPNYGSLEITDSLVVINYNKDLNQAVCNGRTIDGKKIFYKANDGYIGSDFIEIEAFYANGAYRLERYTITVR